MRTKYHHFAAAALYRKSVDDLEANRCVLLLPITLSFLHVLKDLRLFIFRYGEELARLDMGKTEARKAMDAARKSGVARAVQDDIKVASLSHITLIQD